MPRSTATNRTAVSGRSAPGNRASATSLFLPGVSGNSASSPDSTALDITGDIDLIVWLSTSSTRVLAADRAIISKYDTTTNNRSYQIQFLATGFMRLALSQAGTSGVVADSTVILPSIASPLWVRATWRQSDGRTQFFTAVSDTFPTSWTQLGANVTLNVTGIFASNQPLRIGATSAATNLFSGSVYRAVVKNGIDGTTVFDADFTKQTPGATSFTESSSNGATITINQSGGLPAQIVGKVNLP